MATPAIKFERYGNHFRTYTGKRFYPLDPRAEEIDIIDIAHSLSNMCRFTGHTKFFYPVSQHSVLVSDSLPKVYRKWGLLHDAAETYLFDCARPVKYSEEMKAYRVIEERIMKEVARKFGLMWPEPDLVGAADDAIVVTEQHALFPPDEGWPLPPVTLHVPIHYWGQVEAERQFLMAWQDIESDPIAHFNVTGRK